jgi:hypothetical protein
MLSSQKLLVIGGLGVQDRQDRQDRRASEEQDQVNENPKQKQRRASECLEYLKTTEELEYDCRVPLPPFKNRRKGTLSTLGFKPGPELRERRAFCTATLVKDGQLLVSGGEDATKQLSTTEVLDVALWVFWPGPTLNEPLASMTAVLAPSFPPVAQSPTSLPREGGANRSMRIATLGSGFNIPSPSKLGATVGGVQESIARNDSFGIANLIAEYGSDEELIIGDELIMETPPTFILSPEESLQKSNGFQADSNAINRKKAPASRLTIFSPQTQRSSIFEPVKMLQGSDEGSSIQKLLPLQEADTASGARLAPTDGIAELLY